MSQVATGVRGLTRALLVFLFRGITCFKCQVCAIDHPNIERTLSW